MAYNALLIGFSKKVEKIEIDFDDYEGSMCKAVDGRGVSTIHTQGILDIGVAVGFGVVGYINRYANDEDLINNVLACELSGYDELHSKMVLCGVDDKWNFLPLSEKQVDVLYNYITTGEKESVVEDDAFGEFCKRHNIKPYVPNLGIDYEVKNHIENDKIITLFYDLTKASDSKMESFGHGLFKMSSALLDDHKEVKDGIHIDKKETYYISCCFINDNHDAFLVNYQAIDGSKDKILINKEKMISSVIGGDFEEKDSDFEKSDLEIEDTKPSDKEIMTSDDIESEDVYDVLDFDIVNNYDILLEYSVCFPSDYEVRMCRVVWPVGQVIKPFLPNMKNVFTLLRLNTKDGTAKILFSNLDQHETFEISLDKPFQRTFAYGEGDAFRNANMTFTLKKHEPAKYCERKIAVNLLYYNLVTLETYDEERIVLNGLKVDESVQSEKFRYMIVLDFYDRRQGYARLRFVDTDAEDQKEAFDGACFLPVEIGKPGFNSDLFNLNDEEKDAGDKATFTYSAKIVE